MKRDVIALAKQVVAIPSYVDDQTDERALVIFLETFFRERLPKLSVACQSLPGSERANIVVRGPGEPKLLVVGHIDTVPPNDDWRTNPVVPVVRGGNLYGLGAA